MDSFFAIDVVGPKDGYPAESVDLGGFCSFKWQQASGNFRLVPHHDQGVSKAMVNSVLQHLNLIKQSGELENWIVIAEEGHRVQESAALRSFMIGARKFTRNVLLISTDWQRYRYVPVLVKPS